MVAGNEDSRDARPGEAHNPFAPFALVGGRRAAIFVRVARENDQVDFFLYGRRDDRVQRFKEVLHAHKQTVIRIVRSVSGNINVRVGEVQYFDHGIIISSCEAG